jgi:hypothetical protein
MDKRTWTDQYGVAHDASPIYSDSKGGVWYAFDKPLAMPAARAVGAELAAEWALMNFTPADLLAYINKMKEMGNKGQIVDMFGTLHYMEQRIQWAMEAKSMLELAKCYFVLDDEPLQMQTEQHDQLKEQRWKEDSECRGFFLRQAFVITKGYSAFSESDIQGYLKAQEVLHLRNANESTRKPATKDGSAGRKRFFTKGART